MNIHSELLKTKNKKNNPYNKQLKQIVIKQIPKSKTKVGVGNKSIENNSRTYISCDSEGCRIVNSSNDTYKRPERRGFGGRNRQSGMSTIRMGGCSACGR